MNDRPRLLQRVEEVAAGATGLLALITVVWHDWIEWTFRIDPDHGNGDLEWIVVAFLLGLSAAFGLLARRRVRQHSRSAATAMHG